MPQYTASLLFFEYVNFVNRTRRADNVFCTEEAMCRRQTRPPFKSCKGCYRIYVRSAVGRQRRRRRPGRPFGAVLFVGWLDPSSQLHSGDPASHVSILCRCSAKELKFSLLHFIMRGPVLTHNIRGLATDCNLSNCGS